MVEIAKEKEYQKWLKDLKSRMQSSQIKAAFQVNRTWVQSKKNH